MAVNSIGSFTANGSPPFSDRQYPGVYISSSSYLPPPTVWLSLTIYFSVSPLVRIYKCKMGLDGNSADILFFRNYT